MARSRGAGSLLLMPMGPGVVVATEAAATIGLAGIFWSFL